jgi:hypothetical protein
MPQFDATLRDIAEKFRATGNHLYFKACRVHNRTVRHYHPENMGKGKLSSVTSSQRNQE